MGKKHVILAYSGGLDSALAIKLLNCEYHFEEIIPILCHIGQPEEDIKKAVRIANILGHPCKILDCREQFVRDYIWWAIRANSSYGGYPLGTAIARQLIAAELVKLCQKSKIYFLAEGCSSKGNDKIRFERVVSLLDPNLKIVSPISELGLSRTQEMSLADTWGIEYETGLSHDYNLWNHSIGSGEIKKIGEKIPESKYLWTKNKPVNNCSIELKIEFKKGVPIAIQDKSDMPSAISELNYTAGAVGIGRLEVIEDGLGDLKSWEVYEFPAAKVLIDCHRHLERATHTKKELCLKRIIDHSFSELVYEGNWFHPLMRSIKAFLEVSQRKVNGVIQVSLGQSGVNILKLTSSNLLFDPTKRGI